MPDRFAVAAQLKAVANSLPDPIFVLDYEGRYRAVLGGRNRALYDTAHPLVGRFMQEVLPESKWRIFLDTVRRAIDTGGLQTCEYQLSSDEVAVTENDGPPGRQWFQGRVYPIDPATGELPSAVFLVINVTEQKLLEERLKRLSEIDDLTGVHNRRYFFQQLKTEFQLARRRHHDLALISLDIDHFKDINDRFGHAVGDRVLQHLMKTVQEQVRRQDTVARIGGGEFAVLCPGTDLNQAIVLAERIRGIVAAAELATAQGPVKLTVSLGVGVLVSQETCPDQFLSRVDMALYRAKREGRNRVFA